MEIETILISLPGSAGQVGAILTKIGDLTNKMTINNTRKIVANKV
jgi:hypothetical protein